MKNPENARNSDFHEKTQKPSKTPFSAKTLKIDKNPKISKMGGSENTKTPQSRKPRKWGRLRTFLGFTGQAPPETPGPRHLNKYPKRDASRIGGFQVGTGKMQDFDLGRISTPPIWDGQNHIFRFGTAKITETQFGTAEISILKLGRIKI